VKKRIKGYRVAGFAVGLLALSAAAVATPVTYDVVTGTSSNVQLTAVNGNNNTTLISDGVVLMTSGSLVEFDPTAMTLPSWEFTNSGSTNLAISGGALNGDSLQVTDLVVVPGSPYSSTVTSTGPNSYNFTLGELQATASWQLLNSSGNPIAGQSGTINHTISTFTGQFELSGVDLQNFTLTGISLGSVSVEGTPVNLTANVEFNGAVVPLPGSLWLLVSALLALLILNHVSRRRAAAPDVQGLAPACG
jgi:hypothetical protein